MLCYGWIFFDFAILYYRTHNPQIDHVSSSVQSSKNTIPFLGITVELDGVNNTLRPDSLKRLAENGFGWVRHRMDWDELEPIPGQYQWHSSDAVIADIIGAHLVPIVVLDGSPAWARSPRDRTNPLAPPDDFAYFARFAGQFAQRYANQIHFYQIWDEPNIAPHWGNRVIEPVEYARLLASSGQAIRQFDADTTIIAAALAPTIDRGHAAIDEVFFLQRLYAAIPNQNSALWHTDPFVGHPLFDVVAIQPFGFGTTPTDARQSPKILNLYRARLIRRTMLAAGDSETPLWAIRYGWNRTPNSPWRTVSQEKQTRYAIEALDLAYRCWPWLATVGWVIDQPKAPHTDPFWGFSLTPMLGQRFQKWPGERLERALTECSPLSNHNSRFSELKKSPNSTSALALASALVYSLLLWRSWRAIRILQLSIWLSRYRAAHLVIHLISWFSLIWIYHVASWLPLLVLCGFAGVFLCFAQPIQGLCLTILVLPFHYHHKEFSLLNGTWLLPPAQAAMLCLLPALIWTHIHHCPTRFTIIRNFANFKWDLLALSWPIVNILAMANVWNWPSYLDGLVELCLIPVVFYLSVRILISTPAQKHQVSVALLGSGILVALVGLFSWLEGDGTSADGVRRLVGPHFSPNHTALYLVRTLFIALGLLHDTIHSNEHIRKSQQAVGRIFSTLACAIVFIALILTASRGAILIGLPAGVLILSWLLDPRWEMSNLSQYVINRSFMHYIIRQRTVFLFSVCSLFTLAVIVGAGIFFTIYAERLLNSQTILHRLDIWNASFSLWLDHIGTGVGPGGFFWRYPAYVLTKPSLDPNLRHPHNLWLEFITFWGIGGLLWLGACLLLLWQVLRQLARYGQSMQIGLQVGILASFVAALAHAQVDAFAALSDLAGWNWLVIGLMAINSTPTCKSSEYIFS